MANTKEIALFQIRRSGIDQLPLALEEGEFGLATDTAQVFIGCSEYESLKERYRNKTFPYGNLELLTEFSDNLNIIEHHYISNCPVKAKYPIIATSTNDVTAPTVGNIIAINNVNITVNNADIDEFAKTINTANITGVKAYLNGTKFVIACMGDSLVLENVLGNPLVALGYGDEAEYSFSAIETAYRPLQAVLDDYLSAKAYSIMGDAVSDDSFNINAMILSVYNMNKNAEYRRSIFFPAGQYAIKSDCLYLSSYTHLKGEGIRRTIFNKSNDAKPLLGTNDTNGVPSNSSGFGINTTEGPHDIFVENITLQVSTATVSIACSLLGASNVYFRNCEFIGTGNIADIKLFNIPNYTGENVNKIKNITFENCIFRNAGYGIYINNKIENLSIIDCTFEDIDKNAIYLGGDENNSPINAITEGCHFNRCGKTINTPIVVYGAYTKFCGLLHSVWGCDVSDDEWEDGITRNIIKISLLSDTAYTDTLDPTTDKNKFLRFDYPQPKYDYVDRLHDVYGKDLFVPNYNTNSDNEISKTLSPLVIKPSSEVDDDTYLYTTVGNIHLDATDGSVTLDGKNDIQINKALQMNGNGIKNNSETNPNLNFTVRSNGILIVSDSTVGESYETRIDSNNNAIANVGYVKKMSFEKIGTFTINKQILLTEDSYRYQSNIISLGTLDATTHGSYAYIKSIVVQVETPINPSDPNWHTDLKSIGIAYGTYNPHKEIVTNENPIVEANLIDSGANDVTMGGEDGSVGNTYIYEINNPDDNIIGRDLFAIFYNASGNIATELYSSGTINIMIYISTIPQEIANTAEQVSERNLNITLNTSWYTDPTLGTIFSTIPNNGSETTYHVIHDGANYTSTLSGDIGIALQETYTPRGSTTPTTITRTPIVQINNNVYQGNLVTILSPTTFAIQNISTNDIRVGSVIKVSVTARLCKTW